SSSLGVVSALAPSLPRFKESLRLPVSVMSYSVAVAVFGEGGLWGILFGSGGGCGGGCGVVAAGFDVAAGMVLACVVLGSRGVVDGVAGGAVVVGRGHVADRHRAVGGAIGV